MVWLGLVMRRPLRRPINRGLIARRMVVLSIKATHPNPNPTQHHNTPSDQGGARFKSGKRPPEDAPLMPKAGAQDFTGTAKAAGKGEESKALKAAIEVGGGCVGCGG